MKKIYLLFALDMLNLSLLLTIFQRHCLLLDGSYFFIGLVGSCSAVLNIIWKPLSGYLSDRIGSRRVLIWALILSAIGQILTMLSPNKWIFFIIRLGCSVNTSVQSILRNLVTDLVGKDESVDVFNKVAAVFGLSFIVGTLIGGQMAALDNVITYTYLIMFMFNLTNLALALSLPDATKQKKRNETKDQKTEGIRNQLSSIIVTTKQIATSDKYSDLFILKAAHDVSQSFSLTIIRPLMMLFVGLSDTQMSYFVVVMMICSIATSLSQSQIRGTKMYANDKGSKRIQHTTILATISSLFMLVYPMATLVLFQLKTVSALTLESTLMESLVRRMSDNDKGMVLSSYEIIFNVVDIIVPPIAGLIADHCGVAWTVLASAVSFFVANRLNSRYFHEKVE